MTCYEVEFIPNGKVRRGLRCTALLQSKNFGIMSTIAKLLLNDVISVRCRLCCTSLLRRKIIKLKTKFLDAVASLMSTGKCPSFRKVF